MAENSEGSAQDTRGGAAIGHVQDLDPLAASVVHCLRKVSEGGTGQTQLKSELARSQGPWQGKETLCALRQICDLCARYGRRPVECHQADCAVLGADEACMAHFIANATEGKREDAMMMATLLVRPDMAPGLTALAERFGLGLKQSALSRRSALFNNAQVPSGRKKAKLN